VIALDRALYDYFKIGKIIPQELFLTKKLLWIELQLGRIPCIFAWIELLQLLSLVLNLDDEERR